MPAYAFPSHPAYRESGREIMSELVCEMHGSEAETLRRLVKELRAENELLRRMLDAHRPTPDAASLHD